jgi:hypothetical protein
VSAPVDHPPPWAWEDAYEFGLFDSAGNPLIVEFQVSTGEVDPYVQAVTAAAPQIEAMLRRLEFYTYDDDGRSTTVCPVCDADAFLPHERQPGYGWHRDGCELAALLARIDRAKAGG